jgi:DivIVA domain-containing protein
MPLHPDDVVRKTFRTAALRRGYDANDVDAFLEEVVVELLRLRRKVDENQAEIDRLQREVAAGASAQLAVEEQQLEQVRREREALVVELRDADRRIAQAQEDVARAESERDAIVGETQARIAEDLSILKRRAHDAREEARQLADAARQERETVVSQLAAFRAQAEEAVAAELGHDRVAELIAGVQAAEAVGPMADLRVISALAEAVRLDYVEQARTEAKEIRAEAEAERERIIADMTRRSNALLDAAQRQHDEVVQAAQTEHDRLLAEVRDERDAILADLVAKQEQLQSRIEELDRFQHDYRDRIRGLMADQMSALDAGEWRP